MKMGSVSVRSDHLGFCFALSWNYLFIIALFQETIRVCIANHDAKRLYDDLMKKKEYNKLARPERNHSEPVVVRFGLRFAQLIDVDEKNEIITTNMFVIQQWEDHNLRWDPQQYGGVDTLHIPSTSLWLPDIVLYNNAGGDYTVTLMTKATLTSHGTVTWEPPAMYKSYCKIDVEYFPFDEQKCHMKFGSWTYDGFKLDLKHVWQEKYGTEETVLIELAMDLTNFYPSQEWDVLAAQARKNIIIYPCCIQPYPDITFYVTLRRKTLYYAINLIVPCVCINMLTILAFYLPPDCGEKISICISLLLSLSIFQLLLMDLVPATSLTVPLMGRYILFTTVLVSVSVFCSVVILNFNHRTSSVTSMPNIVRWLLLETLPKLLFLHRPTEEEVKTEVADKIDWRELHTNSFRNKFKKSLRMSMKAHNIPIATPGEESVINFCDTCIQRSRYSQPSEVSKAINGVAFLAKRTKKYEDESKIRDDWKYCAIVIDRLMMCVYITACFIGAVSILLNSPILYDKRPALP